MYSNMEMWATLQNDCALSYLSWKLRIEKYPGKVHTRGFLLNLERTPPIISLLVKKCFEVSHFVESSYMQISPF